MRQNHSHHPNFPERYWILIAILISLVLSCANYAWNQAVKRNTILDYEKFINEHPKSGHEVECKNKLDLLYNDPAKVADKGYTLWSDCMKEDQPAIDSIGEKYKKLISANSAENQKAVNDLRKEVLAGKKSCEKIKEVCEEFKNNVCSKLRKEKYTDFGCMNYWEGKEKEASSKIKNLEQELTAKNKELSDRSETETKNQKNLSKEKCRKHINQDVFIYYPGIKIFYPESIP
jgi:hypothetical protein